MPATRRRGCTGSSTRFRRRPGAARGASDRPGGPDAGRDHRRRAGLNGWRRAIYRGPAPPAGKPHVYHFVVYALDTAIAADAGMTRAELMEAMKGHIIGQGEIVPIYERKPADASRLTLCDLSS